jgi:hypothetical protein
VIARAIDVVSRLSGIRVRSVIESTNVVGSDSPFTRIIDVPLKPDPLTVIGMAPDPTGALFGPIDEIIGMLCPITGQAMQTATTSIASGVRAMRII